MEKTSNYDESFRDSISTVNQQGKRAWVFPRKPKGKLHTYRAWVAGFLLAFFFFMPFVKVNGDPFILLDVINRRFILFGQIFWPQDTYLFAVMMLTLIVFIVVFTVALGRFWCGWACPQTIFMEMLFRKIEYWIEGDAQQQKQLKKQPLSFEKFWKRTLKYSIFTAFSLLISLTLFAWVIGVDRVFEIITTSWSLNKAPIIGMFFVSGFLMFIYSWFREQVCVILCPYGRLQGVLLDANTILVAYDYKRGEPRGPLKKDEDRAAAGKGDCIDCHLCVDVCPTAVDIRNGTQLECINCTACIDACNRTMTRINKPKGLIRFDSEKGISTGKKLRLNARLIAYIVVLLGLFSFMNYLIFSRDDIETTILRTPGMLYQEQPDGQISNLYSITVINKKREQMTVELKLLSTTGKVVMPSGNLEVKEAASAEGIFFVYLNENDAKGKIKLKVGVYAGQKLIEELEIPFVGKN